MPHDESDDAGMRRYISGQIELSMKRELPQEIGGALDRLQQRGRARLPQVRKKHSIRCQPRARHKRYAR